MNEKLKVFLLLLLAAFIISGNTLKHGYVLDDDVVYLQNQFVQKGFAGIGDILSNGFLTGFNGSTDQSYRPLVLINFAIEKAIFGNNPAVGHFVNVLLYALCGFLVFLLAQQMFPRWSPLAHLSAALIFLAHPVHTEVIANIKGRDDILHFVFAIGALYWAFKYVKQQQVKHLAGSAVLLFLAMLCKEMAVTFLAAIPLTLYFFTPTQRSTLLKTTGSYVAVFALYMLIRTLVLDDIVLEEAPLVVNNALAAAQNELERLSTCLLILLLYLKLLFVPHPLSWDYSFNQIPIVGPSDWQAIVAIIGLLGLGVYALLGVKKKNPLAWAILFFFIVMSVVSNIIIPIGATLGERFLFTPSFAFPFVLLLLLSRITKVELKNKQLLKQTALIAPIGVILLLFLFKTIQRNQDWKDNFTLYESGVRTAPNSTRTWGALGSAYRVRAESAASPQAAQSNYLKAIDAYQNSTRILDSNFDSWYNLGISYERLGNMPEAMKAYRNTLKHEPEAEGAWNNIGVYFFNNEEFEKARVNFRKVIEINPQNVDATTSIGTSYLAEGNPTEAIPWFLKAIEISPQAVMAMRNLSMAYTQTGQPEEAAKYRKMAEEQ